MARDLSRGNKFYTQDKLSRSRGIKFKVRKGRRLDRRNRKERKEISQERKFIMDGPIKWRGGQEWIWPRKERVHSFVPRDPRIWFDWNNKKGTKERWEGKRIIFAGEGISRGILVEKSKTFLLPPFLPPLLLPSFFHRYFPQLHLPPKRSRVGGRSTSREIVLTIAVSKQTGIVTRGN